MKLKIGIAAVFILFLAVTAAVAIGIFDARTKIRPTRPFVEPLASTIEIAPFDQALTFARLSDGATIAVLSYENGEIEGAPLVADEDAISLVDRIGYDGVRTMIETRVERISVDAASLDIPIDLKGKHIAAGTNFRDHAREADVDSGPFLFPKYVRPTASRAAIPAGDALLDYEVELCLVAMKDLAPDDEASGGLVLCNDVTDRKTLLREIDPRAPQSGKGFTSGKSANGYLPVGDLFVVARDLNAFVETLTLKLTVDGEERQDERAASWIWDFNRILIEARKRRDLTWEYWGGAARLPVTPDGVLPARTMIMAGTPGGTIFKGLYPSAYPRGIYSWTASGLKGRLAFHVVDAHIKAAEASGDYLQPGSLVSIEVDRMGTLSNRIER